MGFGIGELKVAPLMMK